MNHSLRNAELPSNAARNLAPLLVESSEPGAQRGDQFGLGRFERTRVERRIRVVLDLKLNLARGLLTFQDRGERQREVDAGRNACSGDDVAVDYDALAHR